MEGLNTFKDLSVNLYSLVEKSYTYGFKIGTKFFNEIEDSPVSEGVLDVTILLERQSSMIVVDFVIKGAVSLTCDKSLDSFEEPVDIDQRLVFKLGDRFEELSEEMYLIPDDLDVLNLGEYVYELIIVQIPFRKIHPDLREEDEEEEEELVYTSMSEEDVEAEPEEENEGLDPRWKALESLKSNKLK